MSPADEPVSAFERNVRTVLEQSVQHIDARTRSRLNQARQAALAAQAAPRRASWWRSLAHMPAAGAAAAALLVAVTFMQHRGPGELPVLEGPHTAVAGEDYDLLADSEGLDLVENGDGQFYEWAAAQADNGESESQG